jgi:hypothetical protein
VSEQLTDDVLKVFEGVELQGRINVEDEALVQNIRQSIRLGYPQIWPQPLKYDRVALVGGGPSLEQTFDELRDLVWSGAKLVTVNGAYRYCVERNLTPSAQIVLDARAHTAKFLDPVVPGCRYYLASQCHPEIWRAVEGREHVGIFHALSREEEGARELDKYYLNQWTPITGGTTVVMRSLGLLRTIGYVRFDLFGVDSCYLDGVGHAYSQPENDKDRKMVFTVHPTGHPEMGRKFVCSPWMLKQLECFLLLLRLNGKHFRITVHGDGLLAYALSASADIQMIESE